MLNDYRRRRDEILMQFLNQEISADEMNQQQAAMEAELSRELEEEVLAQLGPPLATDLIERLHYLTHIDSGRIQQAIWNLVAQDRIAFDSDLRLLPVEPASMES